MPLLAFAAKPYGDVKIQVKVGEPFTIASAPPTFAFPTLHQIIRRKLFLAARSAPDASLAAE